MERDFLSIGEVLARLLEEFPDVTISKIRFLESQGLIDPERTPSGYRKFTDSEVDRLRFILREQRQNYLPLRVIKDRLEDDTAASGELRIAPEAVSTSSHPAARALSRPTTALNSGLTPSLIQPVEQDIPHSIVSRVDNEQRRAAIEHADRTESIPREELVQSIDVDPSFLRELEQAGLVSGHDVGDTTFFDNESVVIAGIAREFRELGIDVRHLRAWRTSVDRELGLYEQRILPLLRQRNPSSREEAMAMLGRFLVLGEQLRSSLLRREVSRITEQR